MISTGQCCMIIGIQKLNLRSVIDSGYTVKNAQSRVNTVNSCFMAVSHSFKNRCHPMQIKKPKRTLESYNMVSVRSVMTTVF